MSGIIETIDQALEDYELSDDAMRWTPDPVAAGLAPYPRHVDRVAQLAAAAGFPLEPWQREFLVTVSLERARA